MSKLALLGGKPVVANLLNGTTFTWRHDLEREYLLEAHETGVWDDWPAQEGSMARRFQDEWAEFNNSRFAALVTNGTHTLQLAYETLDIGFGDEVIVPGLTWQATAATVCDVNAVPVIVDVDPETLCIDPEKVEAAITPRTRAIAVTHIYHRMADMDVLVPMARKHGLHIVEDCAHTHGSRWDNQGAGTLGDLGSYSFQRSKLMTSGEGGSLLMQNEDYYWRVVSQRSCGREFKPGVKVHSGDYRLTSFQGAVLLGQLAAMRDIAPLMDRNGLALDAAITAAPGVRPLRRNKHITRQCSYVYAFRYDKQAYDGLKGKTFREALSAELGVGFGTTYTPLSHSEVYYPHTKKRHQLSASYLEAITPSRWDLPVAEGLWRDGVALTGWDFLACPPERAHIVTDAITKVYENRRDLLARQSVEGD